MVLRADADASHLLGKCKFSAPSQTSGGVQQSALLRPPGDADVKVESHWWKGNSGACLAQSRKAARLALKGRQARAWASPEGVRSGEGKDAGRPHHATRRLYLVEKKRGKASTWKGIALTFCLNQKCYLLLHWHFPTLESRD